VVEKVIESPRAFLRKKFAEYYRENAEKIPLPTSFEKREFGFILFKEGVMVRHRAFTEPRFFRDFIRSITPSDAYYSAAYYEKPDLKMEEKGWLGGDLVFDIDSDHIPTTCKKEHEYWTCESCDNAGVGKHPTVCPKCGGRKFKEAAWLCNTCLEAAKAEALKLIDFLVNDFGFHPSEVDVCFSGQRGYHIHVERENIRQLDQDARKEIVDYIIGTGLKVDLHGLMEVNERRRREVVGPDLKGPGWRGKMARGVYDLLVSSTPQQLREIKGVNRSTANIIDAHRDDILKAWNKGGPWGAVKGIGVKTWEKLAELGVKRQSVVIDTVVTTDIHRLIRMPFTLHGKTGLKVVCVSSSSLESLDPLRDAVAFDKGKLKVHVKEAHRFRLGEESYGPYKEETVELPTAAVVYLLCKRAAF
jgi:DNA primase small subunit